MDRHIDGLVDSKADGQMGWLTWTDEMNGLMDRQTHKSMNRHNDKHTNRRTDPMTYTQIYEQTNI